MLVHLRRGQQNTIQELPAEEIPETMQGCAERAGTTAVVRLRERALRRRRHGGGKAIESLDHR